MATSVLLNSKNWTTQAQMNLSIISLSSSNRYSPDSNKFPRCAKKTWMGTVMFLYLFEEKYRHFLWPFRVTSAIGLIQMEEVTKKNLIIREWNNLDCVKIKLSFRFKWCLKFVYQFRLFSWKRDGKSNGYTLDWPFYWVPNVPEILEMYLQK